MLLLSLRCSHDIHLFVQRPTGRLRCAESVWGLNGVSVCLVRFILQLYSDKCCDWSLEPHRGSYAGV